MNNPAFPPAPQGWQPLRLVGATGAATLLLAAVLALSACGARQAADPVDPYARYRPAVLAAHQAEFDGLAQAPRYAIDVRLRQGADEPLPEVVGRARIEITNASGEPWSYLMFRLYPALPHYGGEMRIERALIDGRAAVFTYRANGTALRVNLPDVLLPGEAVTVDTSWTVSVPAWPDLPAETYALFGRSQGMISLPLFYPALAVYQDGASGASGWWLEQGSARGDAAFNVASLFAVTATLPLDFVPVASGTLITSTVVATPEGRGRQHVWVAGPAREFFLHTSPFFDSATAEAYGTRVTSYWLPGDEGAGRDALTYAAAALRIYSDDFGPYPFRDMSIAPAPLTMRGMEYPQVNLIGVQAYREERANLEFLVAHEVAHQWWYQTVHSDPVNEPWLDEALAEYSVKLYFEGLRGSQRALALQAERWQRAVDSLRALGGDAPIAGPVASYGSGAQYEAVVYGKGALFYDALRQEIGERRFRRFLQEYLAAHRYGIVDEATWLTEIEALDNPRIEELYRQWIAGAPPPEPTATPEVEEDDVALR